MLEACRTEEEVFEKRGLHFVPPELRENAGEFTVVEKQPFPRLLEWMDLKGSLHNHSNWSDGRMSLEDIAKQPRLPFENDSKPRSSSFLRSLFSSSHRSGLNA